MYKVTDLIPSYRKLNKIYEDVLYRQELIYEEQRAVFDFYERFCEIQSFESIIIELINDSQKEDRELLIGKINQEINKNNSLYKENKSFFDNIDLYEVCKEYYNRNNQNIAFQATTHKEAYERHLKTEKALREANEEDKKNYQSTYNHFREIWEKEKNKHYRLLDLKRELEKETYKYHTNTFGINNKLSNAFLDSLEYYFPVKEKRSIKPINNDETTYFETELISKIYKVCNNEQFEYVTELDFIFSINLYSNSKPLKIKKDEIIRVYYLIYKLYNICDKNKRKHWLKRTLHDLEIKKGNYDSKSKYCSSDTNKINIEYTEQINKIFK
ncbi:type 1 periplasmic-binding domain-containing protein [Flavobacterium undicola]|uniref:hypothetical protein n=1 Tax=Flavobacterium undicola TaxID=1932779 RepID=UPI0013784FF1|nr:hypothetical protein [Flavobacterium undicola]MBA0882737.1 hypothetical protein [Flavobacterium undicola]